MGHSHVPSDAEHVTLLWYVCLLISQDTQGNNGITSRVLVDKSKRWTQVRTLVPRGRHLEALLHVIPELLLNQTTPI